MEGVSIHHVGQVVDEYETALALYEDVLGAHVFETRTIESGGEAAVRMAFTELAGRQVHLICREQRGTDMDGLLDDLLAASPYHVAYTVPDIDAAIEAMENAGIAMRDREPTDGLGPYRRAFADPEAVPGIPFEFIELTE